MSAINRKYFFRLMVMGVLVLVLFGLSFASCKASKLPESGPEFSEVTVHDPMITKEGDTFYLFGSHLASAKSDDLIDWSQMTRDWNRNNSLIPEPEKELQEALEWPEPENAESTWAKSVIELEDKYYMYFSSSSWGAVRSAIGLAVADDIEGPYEYQGFVVRSYNEGEENRAGVAHNPGIHPNAIDPHVFFDARDNLWMIYGSYSGGIFILELDPETGLPKKDQGYGKKISGGHHAAMEGPYVLYNPETEYYYLMISFGTLAPDGGYNIRVARSENPDGPYLDPRGKKMEDASGSHYAIKSYGAKLIGNFEFVESGIGYLSPGHNSAYYDEKTGEMYAVFHSRFPGQGNRHNVRVHQMAMNQEDWPVMAPHRYGGEKVASPAEEELVGTYQFINHGREISDSVNESENIELTSGGEITGAREGEWEMTGEHTIDITIAGNTYHGVVWEQWDDGLEEYVLTFSGLSDKAISVWGSKLND
ncbi:MAG: glycoside hydrolase family 43 protein [Bacillota bacterium]